MKVSSNIIDLKKYFKKRLHKFLDRYLKIVYFLLDLDLKGRKMTDDKKRKSVQDENKDEPFRPVFEQSMDAILIIDGETRMILEMNQTVESLLGYTRSDLLGVHFKKLFPVEFEFSLTKAFEKIKVYGSVFVQEIQKADGSTLVMDLTVTMIPWKNDSAMLVTLRDVAARIKVEQERENLIKELQDAMDNIKTLKGLLPICSFCKKVRNDNGYWEQVEVYVRDHSDAKFTHGFCPDCLKEHFPEFADGIDADEF